MVNEQLQENEQAVPEANEKPALTPEQQKAKNTKVMTVVTYSIALLCMLAGLFVPLFGILSGGKIMDRMFLKYVLGVFNALLFPFVKKDLIPLPENGFFAPLLPTETFSPEMLALTVYILTTVVGLFMLIPVLIGNRNKRTSAICAYVIELFAVLSSGYFIFSVLKEFAWGMPWMCYNLIIVFGGVLLMMAVQSVYNKGGLGVSKIILMVLSALVFFFLLDLGAFIPALGKVFNPLSKALGSGEEAAFTVGTDLIIGINGVKFLTFMKAASSPLLKVLYIVGGALVIMCLFNFAFDMLEITTNSKFDKNGILNRNKPMSAIAILRYALALALAAALIVMLFIVKGNKPGIYLYAIALIILIQLIFAIVRAAILASKHKKAVKADAIAVKPDEAPQFVDDTVLADEPVFEDEEETTITLATPVYEEKEYVYASAQPTQENKSEDVPMNYALNEEPEEYVEEEETEEPEVFVEEEPEMPEESAEQLVIPGTPEPNYNYAPETKTDERTYVYNYRAVYNGPTDEFMDTLNDAEKIEFVQIFLEKTRGKIKGVPEYTIGQDNSDFFPSVFIHINRSREIVSTNLLEKIYKQINR